VPLLAGPESAEFRCLRQAERAVGSAADGVRVVLILAVVLPEADLERNPRLTIGR
jgi:hypothetical protein